MLADLLDAHSVQGIDHKYFREEMSERIEFLVRQALVLLFYELRVQIH